MSPERYLKPEIKTLTVGQILESLGPVSCGSGAPLGAGGAGVLEDHGNAGNGGRRHMN